MEGAGTERPTILLSEPIHEDGMAKLQAEADVQVLPEPTEQALRLAIRFVDAVIVRLCPVSAEAIEKAQRLRVIGRHGVGVDNVDLDAATRRGVPVVYAPQTNAVSVAEHTIAMMLALAKNLMRFDQELRIGRFQSRLVIRGIELEGKTLGVIGLGNIGRLVAEKCRKAFHMRVLGYDPYISPGLVPEVELVENLEQLLREADVITLHVPLTEETRNLLGRRELALLKPTALLINTSRGAVVDEEALAEALHAGSIAGAALDVFSIEPPPPDHPILSAPNTLLSPHVAAHTEEALRRMALSVVEDVLAVLRGDKPHNIANPEVYEYSGGVKQ